MHFRQRPAGEPQKSLYWSCSSRWISCETATLSLFFSSSDGAQSCRPKIMMGLRCCHQGRACSAAGCRPSPARASQKERELPIPCNFRRSRCLGKWAATVWRRRWNSWKIKHSRAITNNLLALHHPENALFLRNWLQSSLVLYTKDCTWPIISSSRLLKANHPFCSCRNPILISQKISWGISLTITINLGCVCKITHLKSTPQALRLILVIFSAKIHRFEMWLDYSWNWNKTTLGILKRSSSMGTYFKGCLSNYLELKEVF